MSFCWVVYSLKQKIIIELTLKETFFFNQYKSVHGYVNVFGISEKGIGFMKIIFIITELNFHWLD